MKLKYFVDNITCIDFKKKLSYNICEKWEIQIA